MTTSRILPIANLVGCLLITGIIIAQWLKERGLDSRIETLSHQLVASREQSRAESIRNTALQADIAQLKESIESTVKARKEAEDAMAKTLAESEARAAAAATASQTTQDQVKAWETAIAARDEKIRSLSEALAATRARLDDAIAKLQAAGAR